MPAQAGIYFVVVAPPRLDSGLRRYHGMFVPNRAGMSLHIDFEEDANDTIVLQTAQSSALYIQLF